MPDTRRQCAYCLLEKTRIWNQQKLKDGSRVHIDEKGARWAGRRCPDCERKRVKHALSIDDFHKHLVEAELTNAGYRLLSQQLPFRVEKDGKTYKVTIKRASALGEQILVDELITDSDDDELVVLTFHSVRVLKPQQVDQVKSRFTVYQQALMMPTPENSASIQQSPSQTGFIENN